MPSDFVIESISVLLHMGNFVVVMRKLWRVRVVVGEEGVGAGRGVCGCGSGFAVRGRVVVVTEEVGGGGSLDGGWVDIEYLAEIEARACNAQ